MALTTVDGFAGIDAEAQKKGIELEYKTSLGDFHIRAKFASNENSEFQQALTKHLSDADGKDLAQEYEDIVALWYDTIVVEWSTTVTVSGSTIKSTRQNFIDMMKLHPFRPVFTSFREDSSDWHKFEADKAAEYVEEAVKN